MTKPPSRPRKRVLIPGKPYRSIKKVVARQPRAPKRTPKPEKRSPPVVWVNGHREVGEREGRLPAGSRMIYALLDPATLQVRYIGQTGRPTNRLRQHRSLTENRTYGRRLCQWVTELVTAGTPPRMVEIAISDAPDQDEAAYIAKYRERGADLLNMNGGGQDMGHCAMSPHAVVKGSRQSPLQRLRKRLSRGLTSFRSMSQIDKAEGLERKVADVDAAISRLVNRMGSKRAAYDYMNAALLRRRPEWFGGA